MRSAVWDALGPEHQRGYASVCPQFTVELSSPLDEISELHGKVRAGWLANGTQLAFLIDPETETSWIYRAGQAVPDVFAGFDRELSGEPALPGFTLNLRLLR